MLDRSAVQPRNILVLLEFTLGGLLLFLLYLSSFYNYLLFHTLAELFSIIIAFGIFMVTWNGRPYIDHRGLVFLGLSFFTIGALDLLHALAYQGMEIFAGYGANLATQLWVAARYVQAGAFLAAPLLTRSTLRPTSTLFGFLLLTAGLIAAVFIPGFFPVAYQDGLGLTPFKIASEYVICLMLAISLFLLQTHRQENHPRLLKFISAAILFSIISELLFTSYLAVYDNANLAGHLFKIIAFYLLYKSFIEISLQNPFQALFQGLERSRDELRRERDFVSTILDTSYALLMVVDDQGRILRYNQALSQSLGLPTNQIEGRSLWDTGRFLENKTQLETIYARLLTDTTPYHYESRLPTAEKRSAHISWSISAHFTPNHQIEYSVWTGIDISDRIQAEDELRYLSTHDTLTGLYNRAFFETEMVRLADTDRFPASLVIADVDGLKAINDQYGHLVGDKLLQRSAHILRSAFRSEDVVARIGGDEFAVLLPDADQAVLEHGQRRVEAIMAAHNQVNPDFPISMSLGGATSPDGYMLMETYKKADQAMYQEKSLRHARKRPG